MGLIVYKSVDNSIIDVDDKSRVVKNVLSRTEMVDSDNDIITKSAYNKTISEFGPQGANLIYHLIDHKHGLTTTLGKFSELYMEGDQLVGVTKIDKTTLGNDTLEQYKAGTISQHSVGFDTIKQDKSNGNGPQIIREVKLYEGSAVLWGANDQTPNLSVGKSLKTMTMEQKQTFSETTFKRLDCFIKLFKNGKISDETGFMLEFQIKQIRDELDMIFKSMSTPPDEKSVEPVDANDESIVEDIFKQLLLRNLKINNL